MRGTVSAKTERVLAIQDLLISIDCDDDLENGNKHLGDYTFENIQGEQIACTVRYQRGHTYVDVYDNGKHSGRIKLQSKIAVDALKEWHSEADRRFFNN
jgi:hypothetical protein